MRALEWSNVHRRQVMEDMPHLNPEEWTDGLRQLALQLNDSTPSKERFHEHDHSRSMHAGDGRYAGLEC